MIKKERTRKLLQEYGAHKDPKSWVMLNYTFWSPFNKKAKAGDRHHAWSADRS